MSNSSSHLTFGSYEWICSEAALIVCPLLGEQGLGVEPACYARNVEVNSTLIFQPASCFVHIIALLMTAIMVFHVKGKYTAVGRKEIVLFFYLYAIEEILALFLDSAIAPTSTNAYAWLAAIHTGVTSAAYWCLLLNGFVGFQLFEDGTNLSLWTLRGSSLIWFVVVFFISIGTFKSVAGMTPEHPVALWVFEYIFNGVCIIIYFITQIILVLRTLDDRWPIADILFGAVGFAAGQVIQYGFSVKICNGVEHYIDGQFFASLTNLFAVMMVYKYWDSITKEDLEFSVGSKQAAWEIKENFIEDFVYANPDATGKDSLKGRSAAPPSIRV